VKRDTSDTLARNAAWHTSLVLRCAQDFAGGLPFALAPRWTVHVRISSSPPELRAKGPSNLALANRVTAEKRA
jgi:hypothetical protein